MGMFSALFGGTGKYGPQDQAAQGYVLDMNRVRDRSAFAYSQLVKDLDRDRHYNYSLYTQQHRDARKSWERQVERNRAGLKSGLDQSYATLASGRDDTLALLRQATEEAMARGQVQNAFTGTSQTSWGAGQLNAIGTQGALQQGAVIEQYAQTLAAAKAQSAAMLSDFDTGVAGVSLGLGMDKARFGAEQGDRYTAARTGIGMQAAAVDADLGQTTAMNRFNARWQATNNNSLGNSFGKSLVGAGIGAIGALVGGPAGAMVGMQLANSATTDNGGNWGGGGGGQQSGGGMGSMLSGLMGGGGMGGFNIGSLFGGG